jgi:hypothetical protein
MSGLRRIEDQRPGRTLPNVAEGVHLATRDLDEITSRGDAALCAGDELDCAVQNVEGLVIGRIPVRRRDRGRGTAAGCLRDCRCRSVDRIWAHLLPPDGPLKGYRRPRGSLIDGGATPMQEEGL